MATYEILRALDRGGMAEVFLARLVGASGFEKLVVLKRVLPHLSGDARFLARFVDEARLAAKLSHPNIVQIFELGEERGQYFIAMEYVDGSNLKELMRALHARRRRVPVEHALRIGCLVLDALHYAHTRKGEGGAPLGLVHRDVSPANVLVSYEGAVKLIDFGIARTLEHVERTHPGHVIGKAGYMSPEQARGEPVDARTDVFACAATLYHAISGVLPFPGRGRVEVMHAIAHGERRSRDELAGDLDGALLDLLERGCAHDVDERFASAADMATALERYLRERGLSSSTVLLGELMRDALRGHEGAGALSDDVEGETESKLVTLGPSAFTEAARTRTATSAAGSGRARRAAAVALGLLVVASGAAWLASSRGPPPAPPIAAPVEPGEPVERAPAPPPPPPPEAPAPAPAPVPTVVERGAPPRARVVERRAPARLTLDTDPWSEVHIDGRLVGLTPLHALELPAGKHRIWLVNRDARLEKQLHVTLRAGEERRMRVSLP